VALSKRPSFSIYIQEGGSFSPLDLHAVLFTCPDYMTILEGSAASQSAMYLPPRSNWPTPWVWVYCERCQHHAPLACAIAVIRWGSKMSSDKLRRSARCTRCGHKGATIQHPGWPAPASVSCRFRQTRRRTAASRHIPSAVTSFTRSPTKNL
jgi:hypothetical protein